MIYSDEATTAKTKLISAALKGKKRQHTQTKNVQEPINVMNFQLLYNLYN